MAKSLNSSQVTTKLAALGIALKFDPTFYSHCISLTLTRCNPN